MKAGGGSLRRGGSVRATDTRARRDFRLQSVVELHVLLRSPLIVTRRGGAPLACLGNAQLQTEGKASWQEPEEASGSFE